MKLCLNAGAYAKAANIAGMTPLHWASAWGNLPSAKALMDAGADPRISDIQLAEPATRAHALAGRIQPATADADSLAPSKLAMLRQLLGARDAAAQYIQGRVKKREANRRRPAES